MHLPHLIAATSAIVLVLFRAGDFPTNVLPRVRANGQAAVAVNAGITLAPISAEAVGVNTAVEDDHLMDGTVPSLLKQAGVSTLRYPGGSTSDVYHWKTDSITPGRIAFADNRNAFDAFMRTARDAGAAPIITVNYGTNVAGNGGGDPSEAAAWVRYANVVRHYGIKYWEVGNEVYGNGTYNNVTWEADLHRSKGPASYAANYVAYARAMKAVDPSIKVGAVLTAPGVWPDGLAPDWDSTVLRAACSQIDLAIVHWYAQNPGGESDAGLLDSTSEIGGMVSDLRSRLNRYCGARASRIEIQVTETNSVSSNPGKQTTSLVNALFLADNVPSWLEHGVTNVSWWDLHDSIVTDSNKASSLYGRDSYGDYGLLSDGETAGKLSEPPAETPFPSYYGLQMLNHLGKAGDHFVSAASSQPLIAVHAVRQANGDLAILLINKDPVSSREVRLSLAGYRMSGIGTVYKYGEGSAGITGNSQRGFGTSFVQSVPPYSLTTIVLQPGNSPPGTAVSLPSPHLVRTGAPQPAFSESTTVSPSSVAVNGEVTIHTTLTNYGGALKDGIVDIEVQTVDGEKAGQWYFQHQTLRTREKKAFDASWIPAAAGRYYVRMGVFGPNWTSKYYWDNLAGTVIVVQPGNRRPAPQPVFSESTKLSRSSVAVHGEVTIHTTITNSGGVLTNGIVDIEVQTKAGQKAKQWYFQHQTFQRRARKAFVASWTPAAAGTYYVRMGVFGPNWTPQYFWDSGVATITVT